MGKPKADKKRKLEEAPAAAPATLFGERKDEDLGGIFSQSAAFAIPNPTPTASSVAVATPATPATPATELKKKARKGKAVAEVKEATEPSPKKQKVEKKVAEKKTTQKAEKAEKVVEKVEPEKAEEEDVDMDGNDSDSSVDLTHESLKKNKKVKSKPLPKYVPAGETQEDRDRRTVFVGNVPIEAVKSKSMQSQLRAHLLTFAPSAKIESIRFRSVAFGTPTSALPGDGDKEKEEKEATKRAEREKERAEKWRATQTAEGSTTGGKGNKRGDDEVLDKSKSFLDTKGKRKVAFIKGDFHSEAGSCNAYVVFEHPHPDRPKNVAPILDPFEAAEKVQAANGSTFMENTIRVDHVRLPSAVGLSSATNALGKRDAWLPSGTDPKCSLFVGGLDYAAKEEDVRAFFESLVVAERGAVPEGHSRWVTEVRIVRDKDTQLGKGFGYVHFIDRESVDEVIAMPSQKLKFAKKPLRVQPCKTLPSYVKVHTAPAKADKAAKAKQPTGPLPKGNPLLGEKIKDLSKEERKVVKSTDAERQARRLAKKKHKVATEHKETGAVKLAATKAEKGRRAKKVTAKKGRVRSSHALSKMKGQRS